MKGTRPKIWSSSARINFSKFKEIFKVRLLIIEIVTSMVHIYGFSDSTGQNEWQQSDMLIAQPFVYYERKQ